MDVTKIAEICHEANRAYCRTIGDRSQTDWNNAPGWQKESAITGVQFHLACLNGGEEPAPEASHNSWLRQKYADGWKYGPVKDVDKQEHPCCVPYEQLPLDQRIKDYIFAAIVKSIFLAEKLEQNVIPV